MEIDGGEFLSTEKRIQIGDRHVHIQDPSSWSNFVIVQIDGLGSYDIPEWKVKPWNPDRHPESIQTDSPGVD
uniref:Uncharacterized protein n=1 Tax=Desertifilum tharense IPPAS B-1220 TaxID=1781255 RepID=A0ACD5H325_9CYAN